MWAAQYSLRANASPADVWALWADPDRWGDWNRDIDRAEIDGPFAVGSTARIRFRRGPQLRFAITALEHERRFTDETVLPGARMAHEHRVEPEGEGVRISNRISIDGPAAPFYGALMGRRIRASLPEFVESERRLAEGQPALRPVGPGLWIAEAPLRVLGVEAGRRMAVVRLSDGGLFVHSPAELDERLRAELDALGEVRFVVPASAIHGHLFMEQYRAAYPPAELLAAPFLAGRRPDLAFDGLLGGTPDPRWADDIDQAPFLGNRLVEEIVFFHRPSRSLILGDLWWDVGDGAPFPTRLWTRGPRMRRALGPTPAFRLSTRNKRAARRSIDGILEWDFDRIVTGHGEIVETGGREALREAFAWLPARTGPV